MSADIRIIHIEYPTTAKPNSVEIVVWVKNMGEAGLGSVEVTDNLGRNWGGYMGWLTAVERTFSYTNTMPNEELKVTVKTGHYE